MKDVMKDEFEVIMGLMEDLQDKMQYGEEDFSERLGRKKPDLEMMKVEVEPMEDMEEEGYEEEEMGPEESLKSRLMKLRG